jgi:hypothetical protein
MKKIGYFAIVFVLSMAMVCFAQEKGLLIDDFEVALYCGLDGTVDFGAGNGSSVEVAGATDIVHSGKQSLKVIYDSAPSGYMWVARGFGLDVTNSTWLVKPEDIKWSEYNAIAFYMYGNDSKTKVAFDIKDSGNEMWRFMFEDNFKGWKQIVSPFADFFARGDWQPNNADKNATLDFPVKSFQFEPRSEGKGILYFDDVRLLEK